MTMTAQSLQKKKSPATSRLRERSPIANKTIKDAC